MSDVTKDWALYEAGKKYNNSLKCINNANYYDLMAALVDFVNGNQWRNLEITGMRKCVFNIFQKALRFWVASITATNTKIDLEPLQYSDDGNDQMDVAEFASAEIANLLEKFKMDNRIRDALFKAGTMGDVAAHLYFDPTKKPYGGAFQDVKGEICFELVNGTNILFGNANNPSVDTKIQPWIGITGRDLVINLKKEAQRYKANKEEQNSIQEDKDNNYESGVENELEIEADGYGKATYFLVYKVDTVKDKKQRAKADDNGQPLLDEMGQPVTENYEEERETILVSKCVKDTYIYKDVDTGLSVYPISWLTWDKQESQYHGRPPLAEAMETQIWINLMFAMIMFHLSMTAFPKAIYNNRYIDYWSNKIAEAIPVKDTDGNVNIKNLAGYLEPGQMSTQIVQAIQLAYDYLKDILGINEAALGEINPEKTSGKAILATVRQAGIPLENTRANMYEWIEDIGRILLDMMGTYYGLRPIVVEVEGKKTVQQFDFSILKNIWLNVKVDVGTTNIWDDRARKDTMSNLLSQGKIGLIDWLESMDDTDVPNRQKLIDKIKQAEQDQIGKMFDDFMCKLSPELQQAIAQESQAMIGGAGNGMPVQS